MNFRKLFLVTSLATAAATSMAQPYYYPTYSVTNNAPNPITNILMFWQAPSHGYGPGVAWVISPMGITADGNGSVTTFQDLGKPVYPDSLLLMGLYHDAEGEHLTLFMNPNTAQAVQNIAFGTVFANSNETQLISDIHAISNSPDSNTWNAQLSDIFTFASGDAANIPNGDSTISAWTTPAPSGSPTPGQIAIWSDGVGIGSFSASIQGTRPVPAPAALIPFLAGLIGTARRRIRR